MTPIEAARLGRDLEPFRLFWLEDATPAENQEAFRLIRSHTTTPLAVGEIFSSLWDCKDLIQNQLIDYIRATIVHAGGITHLRRIADFAALHQVRTGCHGATDLSPVSMAAAVNFGLWVPNFGIQEYMRHTEATDEVFPHNYRFVNGFMEMDEVPGLGVDLDETKGRQISVSTRLSAGCAIARWHRVELVGETRDERSPVPAAANRYDVMQYRRVGRSGLLLPALSLGLWQNFGADTDPAAARALLLRAFDLGITHFDLANNYGPPPGAAEALLGEVLASELAAHRDELIISTKAGYRMWPGPYGAGGSRKEPAGEPRSKPQADADRPCRYLLLAPFRSGYPARRNDGALASAVKQGKALYAGVSSYSVRKTREASALLGQMGVPCVIHQPSYSMLNRWIEHGLLDTLETEGIGCIVFSPLAQGY